MACANVLCAQSMTCQRPNQCGGLYGHDLLARPGTYQPAPKGWVCPKCDSVWAPFVPACSKCNAPVSLEAS